jgi:uncharacterized protein YqeY
MSIETQLQDLLKEAMRNKDPRTADCVRMIKTKHMERRTAAGFKGELDDALWLDVISAYQKQLRKAREEYAGLGARGAESLPQLDFEIELCGRFLPKMAGEDEVRAVVKETIARMAVSDRQAGRQGPGRHHEVLQGKVRPGHGQAPHRGRAGAMILMGTLGGFPNSPAMVRAEQSSAAPHAMISSVSYPMPAMRRAVRIMRVAGDWLSV